MNGFNLDKRIEKILNIFSKSGYEAYVVGGAIRDLVMGKTPKDWDIATNALPGQVKEVFRTERVIDTGLKHGTVTVLFDSIPVEITTFRSEASYSDNRRPDSVEFKNSLSEDLARRDFTMNALAYSNIDKGGFTGLIDPYDGLSDINNKIIRAVGEPGVRIKEDALRILRALRFASVFSFGIDDQLSDAIHNNKELLKHISAERVNAEFTQILCGENAGEILNAYADVIAVFVPEVKPMFGFIQNNVHHHLDVWDHTVKSIEEASDGKVIRLTMFFHDIGKPNCYTFDSDTNTGHFYGHPKVSAEMTRIIMKRLRYDSDLIDDVSVLVYNHDRKPAKNKVIRMLNELGERRYRMLLEVQEADIKAQAPEFVQERLALIHDSRSQLNKIINEQRCFKLSDLALNGNDLIDFGIKEGSDIGDLLNKLLEAVMDEKVDNNKGSLLKYLNDNSVGGNN